MTQLAHRPSYPLTPREQLAAATSVKRRLFVAKGAVVTALAIASFWFYLAQLASY